MQITATHPETGEQLQETCPGLTQEFLREMTTHELSRRELLSKLDNLPVSADAKALFSKMSGVVLKVGATAIRIGQKILEVVLKLVARFPNASFGLVFGAVAGVLIGTVPLIGFILGPVVTPLLAAFGLLMGAKADFADAALERRVLEEVAAFAPLKGADE